MTEKERDDASKWFEDHECKSGVRSGLQIILTPTGIADAVEARCTACGERKDVSDHSNW